ncbi:unnamed protein product [Rhodiola kirilowii]
MSMYYQNEPWNDDEFFPPSFEFEICEKINHLEQSRDEKLDEYLWYFDSIVTSCPHHGFSNSDLLQRFLDGMMPYEWNWLNDAAGGSVNNLNMDDLWKLINDLAVRSRPREDQAEPLEDDEEELATSTQQLANMVHQFQVESDESWVAQKETSNQLWDLINKLPKSVPVHISEMPEEAQVHIAEPLKDKEEELAASIQQMSAPIHQDEVENEEFWAATQLIWDRIAKLPKSISVLTEELPETYPDLSAELPKTDPDLSMIAPGDHMNNEDEDPWLPEEELHSDYPWELEEELPKSGPVLITNPSEEVPVLTAEATEEIKPGPVLALGAPEEVPDLIAELSEKDLVLTVGAPETDPVLMVEVSQLNPSCFMPIIATEDHIINNDEVQGELEEEHEPKKPTKELSLVTSQGKPPKTHSFQDNHPSLPQ